MSEEIPEIRDPIMAEMLMRSVFGNKKYHGTASAFNNDAYFIKHMQKLIDRLIDDAVALVANEQFIEFLTYQLEYLKRRLKQIKIDADSKEFIIVSLKLIATLLGYHFAAPSKKQEPYFIPTIWAERKGWNDFLGYLKLEKSIFDKRDQIVKDLLANGYTFAEIAKIMNISNYKVAQIAKK